MPKLVLKVSQVPDWGRRAIRLSLALTFFTTIAIWLWPVPEHLREEWGDEVRQTCNWAGASCAVVAASPLIGKVAQLSYERTLGTLTGGLLGYLVYDFGVLKLSDKASDILMIASAAAVGALSCYLSFRFSLDASMRLFVITFLIVVFGGGSHSALGVALLRTGGIITGVLLFMGLTVVILPKSATIEALREMKLGLKLLTELNTLVWTSKQEAEAALKAAADKARAAEVAAANAAVAATKAANVAAGSSWPTSSKTNKWRSVSKTLGALFKSQQEQGYSRLPDTDPELGTATGLPVSSTPATAAAAAGNEGKDHPCASGQHPTSHLTQALRAGSSKHEAVPRAAAAAAAYPPQQHAQAPHHHHQQQQQQRGVGLNSSSSNSRSYQSFMDEYEERCEAVLTKVYQSMFKVKEHVSLSDSELYVYHFCGHYMFLPVFFNKALFNWCFPKRWRLPAKPLEEVSTSVRIIARLLWTVHLDFSQEGFDEVIQALPAAAGMGNLLLDLAACTSACLGVLVEAFPNKEAVLVDHLKELEALVNRMLEISGDQHEGLIRDLAANRPKPARPHRAESAASGPFPPSPTHQHAPYQQQQQFLTGPQRSPFSGLPHDLGARPAAAAVAAVAGDGLGDRSPSTTLAAARLGVDLLSPRAEQHVQQQQQQQQEPRQEVWFVTYHNHPEDNMSVVGVSNSLAVDGLGPPIPAESPELWSPTTAAVEEGGPDSAAAAAAVSGPSQPDLIFDMAESPSAAAAAGEQKAIVPSSAGRGMGRRSMDTQSAAAAAGTVGSHPTPGPILARNVSHRSSSGGLGYSSSLIRSQFRPFIRTPTLKLNPPLHRLSHGAAAAAAAAGGVALAPASSQGFYEPPMLQGSNGFTSTDLGYRETPNTPGAIAQHSTGSGQEGSGGHQARGGQAQKAAGKGAGGGLLSQAAANARAVLRSVSAPDKAAAEAAVALLQEYKQQQQEQQESEQLEAGSGSAAQGQAKWQQWQQQQQIEPGVPAAAIGSGGVVDSGMSLVLQALNDPETMSFVKLTRWYSFQFLMMELLLEIHDLYHHIRTVLAALPHGL